MVFYGIVFIVLIVFELFFMGFEKIMFGGFGKKKKWCRIYVGLWCVVFYKCDLKYLIFSKVYKKIIE